MRSLYSVRFCGMINVLNCLKEQLTGEITHGKKTLPKNVQKLIKKLADIQRKEIALLNFGVESGKTPKDIRKKMDALFESGNKAIAELMETRFAVI